MTVVFGARVATHAYRTDGQASNTRTRIELTNRTPDTVDNTANTARDMLADLKASGDLAGLMADDVTPDLYFGVEVEKARGDAVLLTTRLGAEDAEPESRETITGGNMAENIKRCVLAKVIRHGDPDNVFEALLPAWLKQSPAQVRALRDKLKG